MVKMQLLASLLSFVLFLYMVHPCFSASGREMVVVFKGGQTKVPFEENNGTITKRKPLAFRVPAFVGGIFNGKELLVVLCDARYNGFSDWGFIEPAVRTSYGDYTTWSDAEIVVKNTRKDENLSVIGDMTAVIKGDKIYVLAASWDKAIKEWFFEGGNTGWDPLMIVGTVMNRTESGSSNVYVKWKKDRSLIKLFNASPHSKEASQFIGGVGNGVVTKNGTIIFPIQIALTHSRQCVASIIYSTNDGRSWRMGRKTNMYLTEGSVTEWEEGKLLLSLRYDRGYHRLYESDDMGTTWKESLMFNRVWGNQQNRQDVGSQGSLITVPVDGENVLLFSHPLNKMGKYKRDTLQLWMSDGQRIVCVGTISEDGKGERSGYSILAHVGDHLYSVHEINPFGEWENYNAPLEEWDRVIALSSIPDLFDSVKNSVRAWRQVDQELKKIHVPTNGLVGLLAGGNNDTVWRDEYNCVHANVNGAKSVKGGFRFDGTQGSGAQWPVQSQGQNQFYIFTEKQFTLAATVTIHSTKEAGDHLLLGASKDEAGTTVFIGIGYTQDNKWYAVGANGVKNITGVSCDLEREYYLTITFANKEFSVFVDGVAIINGQRVDFFQTSTNHFFFGGIGKSSTTKGSLCTVKNVMLFNRALNPAEITEIKKMENYVTQNKPVPTPKPTHIVFDPKSTPKTDHTVTMEKPKSITTTEPTVVVEDSKSTSTMEPQGTSDAGGHKIPIGDGNDKSEESVSTDKTSSTESPTSDNNSSDKYSKKGHKSTDEAVGLIIFTYWVCVVCSAIALAFF